MQIVWVESYNQSVFGFFLAFSGFLLTEHVRVWKAAATGSAGAASGDAVGSGA